MNPEKIPTTPIGKEAKKKEMVATLIQEFGNLDNALKAAKNKQQFLNEGFTEEHHRLLLLTEKEVDKLATKLFKKFKTEKKIFQALKEKGMDTILLNANVMERTLLAKAQKELKTKNQSSTEQNTQEKADKTAKMDGVGGGSSEVGTPPTKVGEEAQEAADQTARAEQKAVRKKVKKIKEGLQKIREEIKKINSDRKEKDNNNQKLSYQLKEIEATKTALQQLRKIPDTIDEKDKQSIIQTIKEVFHKNKGVEGETLEQDIQKLEKKYKRDVIDSIIENNNILIKRPREYLKCDALYRSNKLYFYLQEIIKEIADDTQTKPWKKITQEEKQDMLQKLKEELNESESRVNFINELSKTNNKRLVIESTIQYIKIDLKALRKEISEYMDTKIFGNISKFSKDEIVEIYRQVDMSTRINNQQKERTKKDLLEHKSVARHFPDGYPKEEVEHILSENEKRGKKNPEIENKIKKILLNKDWFEKKKEINKTKKVPTKEIGDIDKAKNNKEAIKEENTGDETKETTPETTHTLSSLMKKVHEKMKIKDKKASEKMMKPQRETEDQLSKNKEGLERLKGNLEELEKEWGEVEKKGEQKHIEKKIIKVIQEIIYIMGRNDEIYDEYEREIKVREFSIIPYEDDEKRLKFLETIVDTRLLGFNILKDIIITIEKQGLYAMEKKLWPIQETFEKEKEKERGKIEHLISKFGSVDKALKVSKRGTFTEKEIGLLKREKRRRKMGWINFIISKFGSVDKALIALENKKEAKLLKREVGIREMGWINFIISKFGSVDKALEVSKRVKFTEEEIGLLKREKRRKEMIERLIKESGSLDNALKISKKAGYTEEQIAFLQERKDQEMTERLIAIFGSVDEALQVSEQEKFTKKQIMLLRERRDQKEMLWKSDLEKGLEFTKRMLKKVKNKKTGEMKPVLRFDKTIESLTQWKDNINNNDLNSELTQEEEQKKYEKQLEENRENLKRLEKNLKTLEKEWGEATAKNKDSINKKGEKVMQNIADIARRAGGIDYKYKNELKNLSKVKDEKRLKFLENIVETQLLGFNILKNTTMLAGRREDSMKIKLEHLLNAFNKDIEKEGRGGKNSSKKGLAFVEKMLKEVSIKKDGRWETHLRFDKTIESLKKQKDRFNVLLYGTDHNSKSVEADIPIPKIQESQAAEVEDGGETEKAPEGYQEALQRIEKEIYELAGKKFNINSPKQLAEILYNELRIRKPSEGNMSTKREVLLSLQDEHPIIPLILQWREINKTKKIPTKEIGGGEKTEKAAGAEEEAEAVGEGEDSAEEKNRRIIKEFKEKIEDAHSDDIGIYIQQIYKVVEDKKLQQKLVDIIKKNLRKIRKQPSGSGDIKTFKDTEYDEKYTKPIADYLKDINDTFNNIK